MYLIGYDSSQVCTRMADNHARSAPPPRTPPPPPFPLGRLLNLPSSPPTQMQCVNNPPTDPRVEEFLLKKANTHMYQPGYSFSVDGSPPPPRDAAEGGVPPPPPRVAEGSKARGQ